ncbi:MAG: hypothetical protein AUI13_05120 [Gemmatimonadetes bacterium 13_2_20CM_2_69_23]|nr:MAG: hypothetical protein AUI13_05120 [Gemmatimonadetes bacterium 13_2_20CM_2_69_23]
MLKWASVHPRLGTYDFTAADQYVAFGERHRMFIVGHTLVWHKQTPRWVVQDSSGQPVSRDTLRQRLRDHIQTVVGRFRGRIRGWDVVNEALNDDGTLRRTPWLTILGEDYLAQAFRFAHEADPDAELYYNDYALENAAKRRGALELVRRLRAQGVPVTGVGLQGHNRMDWPTLAQQDSAIVAFAALGVRVMITELDISRHLLGRKRRGLLAQQLAGAGSDELSAAVRPAAPSETGVRCGDRGGAPLALNRA